MPKQKQKQKDLWDTLKKVVTESNIVTSIFRHGYANTEKNRSLQIVSNIFFHLHPVRLKEHGFRIRFTWCMGGITFLLFLIELITGILLMFYYRPVVEYAYMDIKSLMIDVPFGRVLRNIHRWGAHLMVITVMIGTSFPIPRMMRGPSPHDYERWVSMFSRRWIWRIVISSAIHGGPISPAA